MAFRCIEERTRLIQEWKKSGLRKRQFCQKYGSTYAICRLVFCGRSEFCLKKAQKPVSASLAAQKNHELLPWNCDLKKFTRVFPQRKESLTRVSGSFFGRAPYPNKRLSVTWKKRRGNSTFRQT